MNKIALFVVRINSFRGFLIFVFLLFSFTSFKFAFADTFAQSNHPTVHDDGLLALPDASVMLGYFECFSEYCKKTSTRCVARAFPKDPILWDGLSTIDLGSSTKTAVLARTLDLDAEIRPIIKDSGFEGAKDFFLSEKPIQMTHKNLFVIGYGVTWVHGTRKTFSYSAIWLASSRLIRLTCWFPTHQKMEASAALVEEFIEYIRASHSSILR